MSFDARILTGVGVLAAVTETGNFARAAEALGLTPSGVSRAVARLEARVGVRLFDRTPRSVTLTGEGRRFHAQVIPLLAGIEEAATEAAGWSWGSAPGWSVANSSTSSPTGRTRSIRCTPIIRLAIFRSRKSGHSWISCKRLAQAIGETMDRVSFY